MSLPPNKPPMAALRQARPPGRRALHPKTSASEAWANWRTTRTAASGAHFCFCVGAWTQGTAAQLLRPPWPMGSLRPSQTDVEERLRHDLELVVDVEPDYIEALAAARRHVLEQLGKARQSTTATLAKGRVGNGPRPSRAAQSG
jgi:hypothetical protein